MQKLIVSLVMCTATKLWYCCVAIIKINAQYLLIVRVIAHYLEGPGLGKQKANHVMCRIACRVPSILRDVYTQVSQNACPKV